MKVREVIKLIDSDGWLLVRQHGSHRHDRHPRKPVTTTIAANLSAEMKPGTLASILRQAGLGRPR